MLSYAKLAALQNLEPSKSFKLTETEATNSEVQAVYRAARDMRIKVSIKTTPEGTRVWRVK